MLQITIPELENKNADNWDTENHTPLVAYVSEKIENDIIPAYDAEGNYHALSATEAPDRLVVVVSQNERIIPLNEKELAANDCGLIAQVLPVYESEKYKYVLAEDYYEAQNKCVLAKELFKNNQYICSKSEQWKQILFYKINTPHYFRT